MTLYCPVKTICLLGDTNSGKTTTTNRIFRCFSNLNFDFYSVVGQNKTKRDTVMHTGSNEFRMTFAGNTETFNTFDDLQNYYNYSNHKGFINSEDFNFCFLHIKDGNPNQINLIDTVGRSSQATQKYVDELTKRRREMFPNMIEIEIVRMPTRNLDFKNRVYIMTHFDIIDFSRDPSSEGTLGEFINEIRTNRLILLSNVENSKKVIISGISVDVYGIDNLGFMINQISGYMPLILSTKNLLNLSTDEELENVKCVGDIPNIIKKYNNKDLYEYTIKVLADYMTLEEMHDIFEEIKQARINAENAKANGVKQIGRKHFIKEMRSVVENMSKNISLPDILKRIFTDEINSCDKDDHISFTTFDNNVTSLINILSRNNCIKIIKDIKEYGSKIV